MISAPKFSVMLLTPDTQTKPRSILVYSHLPLVKCPRISAVGRLIINYAAPVWSPNLHDANYRKIQYTQNEALRIATGWLPISNFEKELTRKEHSTLAQLRSGYCRLLGSYKSRIKKDANFDVCADYGTTPHDVKHLFACPAHRLH